MSAGHDLTYKRRFQVWVLDKVCGYMALDMMDRHKRFLCCVSDSLCGRNTNEKRAHKTRTVCHSDGCDLVQCHVRLVEGSLNHLVYLFNMFSRCDLRHNAAVECVKRDLGRDHVGQHLAAVLYDGSCRLVAGALDCKYIYVFFNTVYLHFLILIKSKFCRPAVPSCLNLREYLPNLI